MNIIEIKALSCSLEMYTSLFDEVKDLISGNRIKFHEISWVDKGCEVRVGRKTAEIMSVELVTAG